MSNFKEAWVRNPLSPVILLQFIFLGLFIVACAVGNLFMSLVFSSGLICFILDGQARGEDFSRLRKSWNKRALYTYSGIMAKSWCTRHVVIAVAYDYSRPEGINAENYYREILGYRWYHVLPDGAPGIFFSKKFWKRTFGWTKLKE